MEISLNNIFCLLLILYVEFHVTRQSSCYVFNPVATSFSISPRLDFDRKRSIKSLGFFPGILVPSGHFDRVGLPPITDPFTGALCQT
jgi:hypothetical protein